MTQKMDTAIKPTREQDFPEWYQQIIKAADLAENSPVRGCMVIKPWGYAIWEKMQAILDRKFKETGHVNAYFPLLIPLSFLQKEAEHVEGFAKECAVVTHHRLSLNDKGKLIPTGPLEEPLVIRPTSETIIGESYSKWVQSYRDLPILINQWANVFRWEMRTRIFLRTAEFLWQEGHTVHAPSAEAMEETRQMLDVFAAFAENSMAMPVVKGEKLASERFPGAINTYSMEALMQDGKALQAGTSHFLGQNFAKASGIKFLDQNGKEEIAWTTSWGVSTRLIGGLIMTHSDDDGLVLPPALAPKQVVILPIYRNDDERKKVLDYVQQLKKEIASQMIFEQKIDVHIDDRDIRGGEKSWQYIKKGVPIRVEVGPRDIDSNQVCIYLRTDAPKAKQFLPRQEFVQKCVLLLAGIQAELLNRARQRVKERTQTAKELSEFKGLFAKDNKSGYVAAYACDGPEMHKVLEELKITARCMPLDQQGQEGTCIFTGNKTQTLIYFAQSY